MTPKYDDYSPKFLEFHEANPEVYTELVALARKLKARGYTQWGIDALLAIVRYNRSLKTTGYEFKINNNHRPDYARLIMATCSDLDGFFRIKRRGYRKDAA